MKFIAIIAFFAPLVAAGALGYGEAQQQLGTLTCDGNGGKTRVKCNAGVFCNDKATGNANGVTGGNTDNDICVTPAAHLPEGEIVNNAHNLCFAENGVKKCSAGQLCIAGATKAEACSCKDNEAGLNLVDDWKNYSCLRAAFFCDSSTQTSKDTARKYCPLSCGLCTTNGTAAASAPVAILLAMATYILM